MKQIHRTILTAALAVAFCTPVLAADEAPIAKSAGKKKTVDLPVSGARPGDAQYKELTGQLVYQVLLAEVALQRGNADLASKAYADLALRTRDPKILERTVEVAGYARRLDLALEAARLWLEVEPSSLRAQQILTTVLLMSDRFDELAPHLIRMLEVDK